MVYRNWTWIHSIGMTGNSSAVGNCHIFKKRLTDGLSWDVNCSSVLGECWSHSMLSTLVEILNVKEQLVMSCRWPGTREKFHTFVHFSICLSMTIPLPQSCNYIYIQSNLFLAATQGKV